MTILLVILLSSPYSNIIIYTDSFSSIQTYKKIKKYNILNYSTLLLKIFFYIYWSYIFFLINIKSLQVKFVKVKAHSGIKWNEYVDTLAKDALFDTPIELNFDDVSHAKYLPKFQNLIINNPVRSFMKTIATTQGFIDFFYLKRNFKFKFFHINWLCTFTNMKGHQDSNTTIFDNSKQHS